MNPSNLKAKGPTQRPLFIIGVLWLLLAIAVIIFQLTSSPKINIEWATATEFDTAGFNIYRSDLPDGEFVQINEQLIPSQADPSAGATYLYVDEAVVAGRSYYYILEDVEYNNTRQQHEAIIGQAPRLEWWMMIATITSALVGIILITAAYSRRGSSEV